MPLPSQGAFNAEAELWKATAKSAQALAVRWKDERDRAVETRENANAVSIRVEAENRRLREALEAIWIYLRLDGDHEDHAKFGAACGVDACILCLAAETAKGALRGSR